jgi:hypothetical protein
MGTPSMSGLPMPYVRHTAYGRRTRSVVLALSSLGMTSLGCARDSGPERGEDEPGVSPPRATGGEPGGPSAPATFGIDADGVAKLYPDAKGTDFRLGQADPNDREGLTIEEGVHAARGSEAGVDFWSLPTYDFEYTEGGVAGKTARLHISSVGASQLYDWHTQRGFLAKPDDLGDQELTAYVRVHHIVDPEHAAFELKVRGGQHNDGEPALASCTMMTFATARAPGVSRFGKELDHPQYDYVNLPLRFNIELREGRWFGLKLVTFVDPERAERVVNRLYVDEQPFLADGSPRNQFRLLTEYVDRASVSTGLYDTLVDWRGYVSTLRIDGVESIDVAKLSARAIAPDGL